MNLHTVHHELAHRHHIDNTPKPFPAWLAARGIEPAYPDAHVLARAVNDVHHENCKGDTTEYDTAHVYTPFVAVRVRSVDPRLAKRQRNAR